MYSDVKFSFLLDTTLVKKKENSTCPTAQHVLHAKDEGLISDEAYHELKTALPEDKRDVLPPISVF